VKPLGARLRRTLGDGPAAPAGGDGATLAPPSGLATALGGYQRLQERMQRWLSPTREPRPLAEAVGGVAVPTPYGDAWVIEARVPLTFNHGGRVLGAHFARPCDHLEGLTADPRLRDFDPAATLFLDIEASGLEHGAGTYAFLIGLGAVEGDEFVVRQLFLREPSDEATILHLLVEALDRHRFLVSFNGKSYDLSVLSTRLIINRFFTQRDCDLKLKPHLDLLHLSKNLYRGLWPDTRLQTLEREALGFERIDDVPGSLVATFWYHYLSTTDAEPLEGVVTHNLNDVLSMVTLADRLVADTAGGPPEDPRSGVNLGRLLLRRRDPEAAATVLAAALAGVAEPAWRQPGLHHLAAAHQRRGDRDGQRSALDALVGAFPDDREALIKRAIFAERTDRDPAAALGWTRQAGRLGADAAIAKRLARLEARLAARVRHG
jgi:hypothetical protein